MDTAPPLADDEGEGLDGSCDFSFSHYPPVQLPLDPSRHAKQPLKGVLFVVSLHKSKWSFTVNKMIKSSASVIKPDQNKEASHVPTAAELFSNTVCYCNSRDLCGHCISQVLTN